MRFSKKKVEKSFRNNTLYFPQLPSSYIYLAKMRKRKTPTIPASTSSKGQIAIIRLEVSADCRTNLQPQIINPYSLVHFFSGPLLQLGT